MSKMQKQRKLPTGESHWLWQLPEMVSSLQKDVFFFEPEEMVTKTEHKEKVNRKTNEIFGLKDDLLSKNEENSKLRTENKKLIEKSELKDRKIEDLEKQLKMGTKVDIPKKQNLPKILTQMSDLPKSVSQRADVEFFEWTEFKFITKQKGANGPSKNKCLQYYIEKFPFVQKKDVFDVPREGFQTLTIPVSAEYKIELVAPGNSAFNRHPGVRIVGKFELKKGQKITAALGQQGSHDRCGSGGSFLVLESDEGPKPLLIAGGAGYARYDEEFGRGNIKQAAVGNENVGMSGKQKFFDGDMEDVYCAGAGFHEAPQVSNLADGCVAPKSYKGGLTGGKGAYSEGGFGGGGASYFREVNGERKSYQGAGGGFTGGSTKVDGDRCWGGGGGSFSADPKAKFDHHYVGYGYCKINRV